MEDIIPYIQSFYSTKDIKRIVSELHTFDKSLPAFAAFEKNSYWYKGCTLYSIYPDSISSSSSPFSALETYLPIIKSLGCNAIHVLPFLASPMQDKGFDVCDYYSIRKGLGGIEEVKHFMSTANTLGIHVFMDLIFNHVSVEHEWFRKAESGDEYYRNFFIHTKDTPQYLGKVYKKSSVYAEYLINGEKNIVSVAFPEFAGEVPHWVKGKDSVWYYHTYYPSQIDLNWKNPDVFLEMTKVLLYWTHLGFDFRLDAIPFVGKSAYKHLNTHNVFTHHLTSVFQKLAHHVNPSCSFILEVNEQMDADIEYFGTDLMPQAQMLYSFRLTTALWISLYTKNPHHLWKQLEQNEKIPAHGQWVNFLRNHDELSLSVNSKATLHMIYTKLLPFGKSFREGYGVAGRTYSLLGSQDHRFLMAYFLLISLPGCVLIPYGDEYGMENVPESHLSPEEKQDARNINRGHLTHAIMQSEKSKKIALFMKTMLTARQLLKDYLNVWPKKIDVEKGIFAGKYVLGTSELVIFINLTASTKTISFDLSGLQEVAHVNTYEISKDTIKLAPYGGVWLQK